MKDSIQYLANIALVMGLVFVGFQLYQDRQLKVAELAFESMNSAILVSLASAGENPQVALAKAIDQPEALTTEELVQLDSIYTTDLLFQRQIHLMELLDIFPEGRDGVSNRNFMTPSGVAYLKETLGFWEISEFQRERLETLLNDDASATGFKTYLNRLRLAELENSDN